TGYSLNGLRISGPQQGLLGSAQSLFTGASVNFAPTAGYLGGTINYQTLRPTKTWTYSSLGTIGNFGASTYSFSATGALTPRLSIAIQHAFDARDDFISGLSYADQSSLPPYLHQGANTSRGDLLRFNYTIDKRTNAEFFGVLTNGNFSSICSDFTTLLPCGYGSVTASANQNEYGSLNLSSLIGNVQVGSYLGVNTGRYGSDQGLRIVSGQSMTPFSSHDTYGSLSYGAYASVTARRHTGSLDAYENGFGGTTIQTYNGVPITVTQPFLRSSELSLSDKVKSNDKLALTHSLSYASATGSGSSLVVSESADWEPAKADVYEASLDIGAAQPNYNQTLVPLDDALSADFDCYGPSTYVDGSSEPAVKQSYLNYTLSWQHTFRGGNVKIDLYRDNEGGADQRASVPIDAEPASMFPSGLDSYLAQLKNAWSLPTVCGKIPFQPQRVYVTQSLTGLTRINQGYDISGRVSLGRNVIALPTYSLGSTCLSSLDPRLLFAGSYYGLGLQLPHKPLRRAGLTIDAIQPKSRVELLLNAQFTGLNNAGNLPAFTVYNAGLVFFPNVGTITLTESNLFGTHTGLFTQYAGVYPMPVVGGGTFSFATTPLPPRQWALTWRIPWSQHKSKAATGRGAAAKT
ncbi:MAG: hypothetical protein ABI182_04395, partial [Candidatus Baltobacteraceae bacterium]